jgi:hypothetical protein
LGDDLAYGPNLSLCDRCLKLEHDLRRITCFLATKYYTHYYEALVKLDQEVEVSNVKQEEAPPELTEEEALKFALEQS